jgi:hypothetical protein
MGKLFKYYSLGFDIGDIQEETFGESAYIQALVFPPSFHVTS